MYTYTLIHTYEDEYMWFSNVVSHNVMAISAYSAWAQRGDFCHEKGIKYSWTSLAVFMIERSWKHCTD